MRAVKDVSVEVEAWTAQFEEVFARIAGRFGRVEPRRCARDYIRGLLGSVERKNSWQIAEYTGHPAPYRFQYLLGRAGWEPDRIRDDVQEFVFERLGESDGVLIVAAGLLEDILAQVIAHQVGLPGGLAEQTLQPVRRAAAGVLGDLPAVTPFHRAQQAAYVITRTTPWPHPAEPQ